MTACAKAGITEPPGWTTPATSVDNVQLPTTADLGRDIGGLHSFGAPIHIYPLYETAFRAHRGQTPRENNEESAALYADFAQTAVRNQNSWNHGKPPASNKEIGTVSPRNRIICLPCMCSEIATLRLMRNTILIRCPDPLLMNAFNTINLAAAVVLTSVENARKLGVPEKKWVYPLGGAERREKEKFWERPNFHHSEAISTALDDCLACSGMRMDNIDALDLYS